MVFWALSSYKPLESREEEPRQPKKAHWGPLVAIGPCECFLGRPGFLPLALKLYMKGYRQGKLGADKVRELDHSKKD